MDDEPEVIRQQMDETRTALSDKLGRLEQQVTDTVTGAVESAVETVESVRNAATDTVENVRTAVQDTVDSVKQSVRSTVETVTDTLDVELQVDRHPWTMVAGAAAVGFVGGYLCYSSREPARRDYSSYGSSQPPARSNGDWSGSNRSEASEPSRSQSSSVMSSASNWLASQGSALQPAMEQLKGLAVGAMFGLAKDLLTQTFPKPMESQITEVIDDITKSFGGKPIRGHMLGAAESSSQKSGSQYGQRQGPQAAEQIPSGSSMAGF